MAKQTFTTGQVLTAAQMTSLQQTAMGGGSPVTKTASYVLVAADAGTVIQMNSASSTTITVNTALFSAGDSVQIQNIGAGVCTITAGTATVNTAGSLALSQWEGGFLYFTSASSAIFFDVVQSSGMTNPMTTTGDTIYGGASGTPTRLGIGSSGQVLTVASGIPSWATPAGGGKVLQVVSATTSTSVSIASTTYTATGLNATITPSASTSKILVLATQGFLINNSPDSGTFGAGFKLDRNTGGGAYSVIYTLNDSNPLFYLGTGTQQMRGLFNASYLDSPATTSACNYRTISQTNTTANNQSVSFQMGNTATSSMILLEIGA